MRWTLNRSLRILSNELEAYLITFPKELFSMVEEIVDSNDFKKEVNYALNYPSGPNLYQNGRFKFINLPVPQLRGSFSWRIESVDRNIHFISVIDLKEVPTFQAEVELGISFEMTLIYWANGRGRHTISVETKIPISLDLKFSDKINDIYFDHLSDL